MALTECRVDKVSLAFWRCLFFCEAEKYTISGEFCAKNMVSAGSMNVAKNIQ